jgi:hypothetical protein
MQDTNELFFSDAFIMLLFKSGYNRWTISHIIWSIFWQTFPYTKLIYQTYPLPTHYCRHNNLIPFIILCLIMHEPLNQDLRVLGLCHQATLVQERVFHDPLLVKHPLLPYFIESAAPRQLHTFEPNEQGLWPRYETCRLQSTTLGRSKMMIAAILAHKTQEEPQSYV